MEPSDEMRGPQVSMTGSVSPFFRATWRPRLGRWSHGGHLRVIVRHTARDDGKAVRAACPAFHEPR